MATGDVVRTQRVDRYHVEINHGRGWAQIHPPGWEHTTLLTMARSYASQVAADHPGSAVRIVRTTVSQVTTLRTGRVSEVETGTAIVA